MENLQQLYATKDKVLAQAAKRLQLKNQSLIPQLGVPETIPDQLLQEWLTVNYMFTVGFIQNGNLVMGEIGGILPTHKEDGKLVLATAEASVHKVMHGIEKVLEADKKHDWQIATEAARTIETELKERSRITIVDGNRNIAHYDFITCANPKNIGDLFTISGYVCLAIEGAVVFSNKCLPLEQYVFVTPRNKIIFDKLRDVPLEERTELSRQAIIAAKDELVPAGFIAGVHIIYQDNQITIRPIVGKR